MDSADCSSTNLFNTYFCMKEKLEKLTDEQQKLMIQTRDEWINLAFSDLNKENDKG